MVKNRIEGSRQPPGPPRGSQARLPWPATRLQRAAQTTSACSPLFGLALHSNHGKNHKLYVADMSGRILRLDLSKKHVAPEVFSHVPVWGGLAGDWMLSIWNDLVFAKHSNLFVLDDKPRIWKISPEGTAPIWVTDPRLQGLFGFAGVPLGGRIDPSGTWLYMSITVAANPAWTAQIWRIRLVDHPTRRISSSSTSSRSTHLLRGRHRPRGSRSRSPATCTSDRLE